MSICNKLNLEILGCQLIIPKRRKKKSHDFGLKVVKGEKERGKRKRSESVIYFIPSNLTLFCLKLWCSSHCGFLHFNINCLLRFRVDNLGFLKHLLRTSLYLAIIWTRFIRLMMAKFIMFVSTRLHSSV